MHKVNFKLTEEQTQSKWDEFLESNPKAKQKYQNQELMGKVDRGEMTFDEAFPDKSVLPHPGKR